MLEVNDSDAFLTTFRLKHNSDVNMPNFYRSAREAEMFCALGRHAESIDLFTAALVSLIASSSFYVLLIYRHRVD
jgi:hypothetical protein